MLNIKLLTEKVSNNDTNICMAILNILELFNKIIPKKSCNNDDINKLDFYLRNLGDAYIYDENKSISERADEIIEDSKFIVNNIKTIWPLESLGHYNGDLFMNDIESNIISTNENKITKGS